MRFWTIRMLNFFISWTLAWLIGLILWNIVGQFSISGRLDDLVVSEFEAPSFSKWGRAQNLSCVQVFWLRKNRGIIYIFLKGFALALVLKQRLWLCRKWPFCLRLIFSSNAIWFSCLPMHVSPMRCYSKLCLPQNNPLLFKICIYIYFFFARKLSIE